VSATGTHGVVVVRVLRVFTDTDGGGGNPLGVVLDASTHDSPRRQAMAAQLGYSETVFVEAGSRLQIFTPTAELPFAGHPLVGSAWLLDEPVLHPPVGPVQAGASGERGWIRARAEWAPPFERIELPSPAAVDAFQAPPSGSVQVWAWRDGASGAIRARVFAPDLGVVEDPATGSAAVALCAALERPLAIDQGPGCRIDVRPLGNGWFELAGTVADDGERQLR
jgi:predicted PhzF superfamily epimerase YddE/YHI9